MKEVLIGLGWILNTILAVSWTDLATISWSKAGVEWKYTLITMLITSNLLICANYGLFSAVMVVIRWVRSLFDRLKKNLMKNNLKKKGLIWSVLRKIFKWSNSWTEKWEKALAKYRTSPLFYFLLFVLNLIPIVPYVSTGTILAGKVVKTHWYGLLIILAGNTLKVILWTKIVYTYI